MTATLESLVATRIDDEVAALKGRVEDIAALAALIAEGALPQADACAFVCPLGFDDRGGNSIAGAHTQMLDDAIAVIICVKARGDAKARKALPTIGDLRDAITDAVAGWAPAGAMDVFYVKRGRLLSADKGLVLYQLDFSLRDQLRIM